MRKVNLIEIFYKIKHINRKRSEKERFILSARKPRDSDISPAGATKDAPTCLACARHPPP